MPQWSNKFSEFEHTWVKPMKMECSCMTAEPHWTRLIDWLSLPDQHQLTSVWVVLHWTSVWHHPDTVLTNQAVNIFNDKAMSHFRKIQQWRQKQVTLDRFLVKRKRKATAKKEVSTELRRWKGENTPEGQFNQSLYRVWERPRLSKQ